MFGKMKTALRWLLVLPCAMAALLASEMIAILATSTDSLSSYVSMFWNALFEPVVFVIAGAYIAPRFKRETATVLAVLFVSFLAFEGGWGIGNGWASSPRKELLKMALGIASATATAVIFWRESRPAIPLPEPEGDPRRN